MTTFSKTPGHRRIELRHLENAIVVLAVLLAAAPYGHAALPDHVDLRSSQTGFRNQKGRRTCIVHSVVAAMEAALKRSGREVDLSEDTFMYFVKQFWLAPIDGQPADARENQAGGWDGGNGVENLAFLTGGLAIPEEAAGRPDGYKYRVPYDWRHEHWNSQFNIDSWNLSPRRLIPKALRARRYFTLTGYRSLPNAKDPRAIERALAGGHEVVWDFQCGGKQSPAGVWHYSGPADRGADRHSVLIVGYDRRNAGNSYFIVKDSHGPTKTPGAKGFAYFSYDFLQYSDTAGYLTGVKQVSWPELRFLGRWEIVFDGHPGLFDVSHLPGVFRGVLAQHGEHRIDRRIGTFYFDNDPNRAARVNGSIRGNRIDFYVDSSNANPGLEKCAGRHFTYYLSEGNDGMMAGSHRDPDGTIYGGFGRRLESDDAFPNRARKIETAGLPEMREFLSSERLSANLTPESYIGTWTLYCHAEPVSIKLDRRDDTIVAPDRRRQFSGLRGNWVALVVDKSDLRNVSLITTESAEGRVQIQLQGKLFNWESGVVAGTARFAGQSRAEDFGAILVRHSGG